MSKALPAEGTPKILVVEDDGAVARSLAQWLELSGFSAILGLSSAAALEELVRRDIDIVLSDVRMPQQDGLSLMKSIRLLKPTVPVILLTGHGDVPMAVEAVKAGAFDFLTKPWEPERLTTALRNAARLRALCQRVADLEAADTQALERRIIGHSPAIAGLREQIRMIARTPVDVLIYGETGTGKELVARAIPDESARRKGPFGAINCAALPADLIESELFGHEAGAYTGARQARVGKLEFAHGGRLLLDEIESMPLAAQAKILRALGEGTTERVGSNRTIKVDLRVVSAAKGDLRVAYRDGRFREDLFFRLAGVELTIPPLRARPGDAIVLFQWFAMAVARGRLGRDPPQLSSEDLQILSAYEWPGNVRELKAAAERFALGLGITIGEPNITQPSAPNAQQDLRARLDEFRTGPDHCRPAPVERQCRECNKGTRHSATDPQ